MIDTKFWFSILHVSFSTLKNVNLIVNLTYGRYFANSIYIMRYNGGGDDDDDNGDDVLT